MTESDPTQVLLAAPHAARALDISERTLWRLVRRGDLEVVRLSDRIVRFRVADLRAMAEPRRAAWPTGMASGRRGR